MGDLDECKNGLTYTFHVNARELDDYTYLVAGGPYSVYYRNGRLHAEMATKDKKWTVSRKTNYKFQKGSLSMKSHL